MIRDRPTVVPKVLLRSNVLLTAQALCPDSAPKNRGDVRHLGGVRGGLVVHGGPEGVEPLTSGGKENLKRVDDVTRALPGGGASLRGLNLDLTLTEDVVGPGPELIHGEGEKSRMSLEKVGGVSIPRPVLEPDGFEDREKPSQVSCLIRNDLFTVFHDILGGGKEAMLIKVQKSERRHVSVAVSQRIPVMLKVVKEERVLGNPSRDAPAPVFLKIPDVEGQRDRQMVGDAPLRGAQDLHVGSAGLTLTEGGRLAAMGVPINRIDRELNLFLTIFTDARRVRKIGVRRGHSGHGPRTRMSECLCVSRLVSPRSVNVLARRPPEARSRARENGMWNRGNIGVRLLDPPVRFGVGDIEAIEPGGGSRGDINIGVGGLVDLPERKVVHEGIPDLKKVTGRVIVGGMGGRVLILVLDEVEVPSEKHKIQDRYRTLDKIKLFHPAGRGRASLEVKIVKNKRGTLIEGSEKKRENTAIKLPGEGKLGDLKETEEVARDERSHPTDVPPRRALVGIAVESFMTLRERATSAAKELVLLEVQIGLL